MRVFAEIMDHAEGLESRDFRAASQLQKKDVGCFAVVQLEALQFRQAQVGEPCVLAQVQLDISEHESGEIVEGPFVTRRCAREMCEEALNKLVFRGHAVLSVCEVCSIDPVARINLERNHCLRVAFLQSDAAQRRNLWYVGNDTD
jgi:hypothetical protein